MIVRSMLAAVGLMVAAIVSPAAAWPDRPITILIPYPPGGATDVITRAVAQQMQRFLGQPITIEHRTGRDGLLALRALGQAAPDGYTLMAGNPTTSSVNPVLHRGQLGFDYEAGVAPISVMSEIPNLMLVAAAFPASDFPAFVEYVRSNPGAIRFGAPGIGSAEHLNGVAFGREAGLDIRFQRHEGGALEGIADLAAGKFDWAMVNVASSAPAIRDGRVKALAVSGNVRVPEFPVVPTFAELGYPDIFGNAWQALFAPGGTPREIVQALHHAVVAAVDAAELRQNFLKRGIIVTTSESPEAFAAALKAEMARRAKAIADAGIATD